MKKLLLIVPILVGFTAAQAAPLVTYTFESMTTAPTTVDPSLTASSILPTGLGTGVTNNGGTTSYILNASGAGTSVNLAYYFSFTITPVSSTLDLSSLTFDGGKGGSTDPRGFQVRSNEAKPQTRRDVG